MKLSAELSQLCKNFEIVGVLIKAGSGSASTERTSEEHSSIEQTGIAIRWRLFYFEV